MLLPKYCNDGRNNRYVVAMCVQCSLWKLYINEHASKEQCKKTDGKMITNLRRQRKPVTKTIRTTTIAAPTETPINVLLSGAANKF